MSHRVRDHVAGSLSELDQQVVRIVPPGGNWRDLPEDFPSARVRQIRHSAAAGKGSRSTYYGRLEWNRPCYTISTYITRPGNGCHIHPEHARLITVREAARLQSFPDEVTLSGPMRARTKQVGNAVPPLLAHALGSVIEPGTVVDLFSGLGGMSAGLAMAGHDVIAEADNDRHAHAAAQQRANGRAHLVDLSNPTQVQAFTQHVRATVGDVDTVVGGPPCQGFSTAGKCDLTDERNRLVLAFIDVVERLKPRNVLMENVPALLWRGRHLLDEARRILLGLGYQSSVTILHAEAYGVPQLRRRLFLHASRDSEPTWPTPTHTLADPAHRAHQPGDDGPRPTATVHDAIADLPSTAAATLDTAVLASAPSADYQRWVRGQIATTQLVGPVESAAPPNRDVFTAAS